MMMIMQCESIARQSSPKVVEYQQQHNDCTYNKKGAGPDVAIQPVEWRPVIGPQHLSKYEEDGAIKERAGKSSDEECTHRNIGRSHDKGSVGADHRGLTGDENSYGAAMPEPELYVIGSFLVESNIASNASDSHGSGPLADPVGGKGEEEASEGYRQDCQRQEDMGMHTR